MDMDKLASEHPELLAQIESGLMAKAETLAREKLEAGLENQLALVKMVAGAEAAEKVAGLSKAGLTAEQVAALGSLGLQAASLESQAAEDKDAGSRSEVLAALRQATPGPVPAAAQLKEPDGLAAAIDQIAAI